jgi:hypothetical protein
MFGQVLFIVEYTSYEMQKWRNNFGAFTVFYSIIFRTEDKGKQAALYIKQVLLVRYNVRRETHIDG